MNVITREQLYREIWTEPATAVARRYRVSSSFLARVLDRMNVPRPRRGYWALAAVGRGAARPPLPPAGPEDQAVWQRAPSKFEVAPPSARQRERRIEAESHFLAEIANGGATRESIDVGRADRLGQEQFHEKEQQQEQQQHDWREQQHRLCQQEEGRRARNIEESRAELLAAMKAWSNARLCERFFDDVDLFAGTLPEGERVLLFRRVARARALLGPVDAAQRLLAWRTPEERP